MKIPRDLSGRELATKLAVLCYAITRQIGSHMRLTTEVNGEHHVTIPDHHALRVGTVSVVLSDVAGPHGLTRDELLRGLFG